MVFEKTPLGQDYLFNLIVQLFLKKGGMETQEGVKVKETDVRKS